MTGQTLPAADQITAMRDATEELERELIAASGDPERFAALEARRRAMLAELRRLGYAERREAAEADQAHRRALKDRVGDARARYGALRLDAEQVERELAALAAQIEHELLPRCAAISRDMHACASQEQNAISALRRLGEQAGHPIIGAPPVPSEPSLVRWWKLVHRMLGAAGYDPRRAAFAQTRG